LEILHKAVETLRKSKAYPYGLTEPKIALLNDAGIRTIGDLDAASDETLRKIDGVGNVFLDDSVLWWRRLLDVKQATIRTRVRMHPLVLPAYRPALPYQIAG